MDINQLTVVPRRNFPNVIPNLMQEEVRRPQTLGLAQNYQPGALTPTPPQPSVKVRLPRDADRSRLARDILKQLGKPTGSAPVVLTRREYKERKKRTSIHPSIEPAAEPQPALIRDDAPSLPDLILGQVLSSTLPANPPQGNPTNELPSPAYLNQHKESAPPCEHAIEQDVDMDIQPSGDPLVPQPSGAHSPAPSQYLSSSLVDPALAQGKEKSARNFPPLGPQSSTRTGPPPDTEVIEISDDEDQHVVGAVTTTVEPMEVDGGVGKGGVISKSLSRLSLDGDDTKVALEMGKEPLDRRSSQELVVFKGITFTEKKSQKIRPYVEVPPLPDYARQIKGKERAPVVVEEEGGPYEVSVWRN